MDAVWVFTSSLAICTTWVPALRVELEEAVAAAPAAEVAVVSADACGLASGCWLKGMSNIFYLFVSIVSGMGAKGIGAASCVTSVKVPAIISILCSGRAIL